MRLSALSLGQSVARRLNGMVPPPLMVSAYAPSPALARRLEVDVLLHVSEGGGGCGYSDVDLTLHGEASPGNLACDMAIAMLNVIQDMIVLILREPWPVDATGRLTLPNGRADAESIYL